MINTIIKSKDQISEYLRIIEYTGKIFRKKIKNGEVFLSKYNLYPKTNIAIKNRKNNLQKAVLTILSYANGNYDLIDILKISKGNIKTYLEAIDILLKKDLIKIL